MVLSKSRRIILNALATYGRSVFALFAGVFSSRWLLIGLGAQDLGLQGVVGSLIGAIVILETVMQVAVARFYAYAIGTAQTMDAERGQDEICRWFNVVFLIHTVFPAVVVVCGYPLGIYAIRHWLNIPIDRLEPCVYVFQCSLVATFIGMISVPYIAMYTAKQMIVELSVFGVLRSAMNLAFAFSLLYVIWDKLKYSATFGAVVSVCILGVQMYRARRHFPECRIKKEYLFDGHRLRQIFCYFFWEIFSCCGNMTRQQGSALIINKNFGPAANAAWSIANTLSNQATALSSALVGAFLPAVTTEEGAGDRNGMTILSFRTCKFGSLLILVFSIPLIAEMDFILKLWLVNPPPYTSEMCCCILIAYAIDKLGLGHHIAISARGKIGLYHCVVGTTFFLSIPIVIGLILMGLGPISVGVMFIICFALVSMERIIFAKYLVEMPILTYLVSVVFPMGVCCGIAYLGASIVTHSIQPSVFRIGLTTIVSLSIMLCFVWFWVLDATERLHIRGAVCKIMPRLKGLKYGH